MAATQPAETSPAPPPVFNTFRHSPLRPFYSLRECQIGFLILAGLVGIAGWVWWRGRHPDPSVFHLPESALTDRGAAIRIYKRPLQPWIEPGSSVAGMPLALAPFPESVRSPGWELTGPPATFDETNLYEKINGREGYYKAYGFRRLHCLGLQSPAGTVDIELFDLGEPANAFGAWAGELAQPAPTIQTTPTGWSYQTRNGGFLAQGRFYARLIGSDDAPPIRQKITELLVTFREHLPAASVPWGFDWLVHQLGLPPASVRYTPQHAFGWDGADDLYHATVPGDDVDVFLALRADATQAAQFADRLLANLRAQGREIEPGIVQHDLLKTLDAVRPVGRYVVGVRLAPSQTVAHSWLDQLTAALSSAAPSPYE